MQAANLGGCRRSCVEPGDELFHPRVNIFHDDSGTGADYNLNGMIRVKWIEILTLSGILRDW